MKYNRILVIGGPRCGKTTYANELAGKHGIEVRKLDSYIASMNWSELSDAIVGWLNEPGPWIMEGVQGVRGLRKWLKHYPHAPIEFEIHLLTDPKVPLTKGQDAMYKACKTIFTGVLPELRQRNAKLLLG